MGTLNVTISRADIDPILSHLAGLPISDVWRSIDPCIFIELGMLSRCPERKSTSGQVTFAIECDWRVEKPRSIHFGSGFSDRCIDNRAATLIGVKVEAVEIAGRIPELGIGLAGGRTFRTFTDWNTQPQWSIGFNDSTLFPLDAAWEGIDVTPWICVRSGRLEVEYCYDHGDPKARKAVKRMGLNSRPV